MYNELYNAVLPSKNQQTSNNFLNNFSIEYDIIQGLKLKANLSLSVDNGKTDVYKSYENTEFLDKEKKGSYAQSTSNDFSYDINVILSYFKSLKNILSTWGLCITFRKNSMTIPVSTLSVFPMRTWIMCQSVRGIRKGRNPEVVSM